MNLHRFILVGALTFLAGLATGWTCGHLLAVDEDCFTDSCVGCTTDCLEPAE